MFDDQCEDAIFEGKHLVCKRLAIRFLPLLQNHNGFQLIPRRRQGVRSIELMRVIRKGQMIITEGKNASFTDQFYALMA
jgi:hypothetical protein